MMKERPNYFAIIPACVRYDAELKANEKLMYGEITALSNATGECWASNNYFAELYGVTPQAVSGWINDLKNKGYIRVDIVYKGSTKEIEKRIISIVPEVLTKVEEGINKSLIGYKQKFKGNNTRNNNTRNNIYADVPEYLFDVFMEWADMRKQIKKPIPSENSVKRALNKLDRLSKDHNTQIAIVEQAIDKNWLSFYPLKEEKTEPQEPRSKAYKEFEPEPEIDAVQMPDEIRERLNKIY